MKRANFTFSSHSNESSLSNQLYFGERNYEYETIEFTLPIALVDGNVRKPQEQYWDKSFELDFDFNSYTKSVCVLDHSVRASCICGSFEQR